MYNKSNEIPFKNKLKLTIITLIMDLGFLITLFTNRLNYYELFTTITILITHILFYKNLLQKYNKENLDILHCFVPILLLMSIGFSNKYLVLFSLYFITIVQFMWIVENKCILNEKQDSWGMSKFSSVFSLGLTIVLSYKLGS